MANVDSSGTKRGRLTGFKFGVLRLVIAQNFMRGEPMAPSADLIYLGSMVSVNR